MLVADGDGGVMAAHHNGITNLIDCDVTGAFGLGGHNSTNSRKYSTVNMTCGTLSSTSNALLLEKDGRTIMNLSGVEIGAIAEGQPFVMNENGGIIVNLMDMTVEGDVVHADEAVKTELHLFASDYTGTVTAQAVEIDEASTWNVTGDSTVGILTISGAITASEPVTINYGEMTTTVASAENITFVQDDSLIPVEEDDSLPEAPELDGVFGAYVEYLADIIMAEVEEDFQGMALTSLYEGTEAQAASNEFPFEMFVSSNGAMTYEEFQENYEESAASPFDAYIAYLDEYIRANVEEDFVEMALGDLYITTEEQAIAEDFPFEMFTGQHGALSYAAWLSENG